MSIQKRGCDQKHGNQQTCAEPAIETAGKCCSPDTGPRIVDHKVTLLIAAGAAMAANCEPCLNKAVPDLIEAGVCTEDIRAAIEVGQYVKDRPAALMKEAADTLAGTSLSAGSVDEGCPAEAMKKTAA